MLLRIIFIFILFVFSAKAEQLENCKWDNREGNPCIVISKTPNTSSYNAQGINKKVFTKS